jgi:hypothetical protein
VDFCESPHFFLVRALSFHSVSLEVDLALTIMIADRLVAGGAVSKVDPDSTGLTPAWRSAVAHALWAETWAEGTPLDDIEKKRDAMRGNIKAMEDIVGSSSYFNEVRVVFAGLINVQEIDCGWKASLYEENPKRTFFGAHYGRLKDIKDTYDPEKLFVVAGGVGSDEWDDSLICRRS